MFKKRNIWPNFGRMMANANHLRRSPAAAARSGDRMTPSTRAAIGSSSKASDSRCHMWTPYLGASALAPLNALSKAKNALCVTCILDHFSTFVLVFECIHSKLAFSAYFPKRF